MDPLLKLLRENASLSSAQLAQLLNERPENVAVRIKDFEMGGVILGYRTILNEEAEEMDLDTTAEGTGN